MGDLSRRVKVLFSEYFKMSESAGQTLITGEHAPAVLSRSNSQAATEEIVTDEIFWGTQRIEFGVGNKIGDGQPKPFPKGTVLAIYQKTKPMFKSSNGWKTCDAKSCEAIGKAVSDLSKQNHRDFPFYVEL